MGKVIGCAAMLIFAVLVAAACAPTPTSTPGPLIPTPLPMPTEVPPTPSADAIPRMSPTAAIQKVGQANVVFLDIRPDIQYEQSHIKGAVSMPVVGGHLGEIPRDQDLILYCA